MTSTLLPEHRVPEGSTLPGQRPAPGPRPARDIWAGASPTENRTPPTLFGRARLTGLDAARGLALIGMVAVHTLPSESAVTETPTLAFSLFGGRAAALFAVLAGVSLALMTGRSTPHTGGRWWRSAASLTIRAALIFTLGLALNNVDLPVYNILPYYGLLFLLAIPFTRLGAVWNLALGGLMVFLGPVLIHLINSATDFRVVSLPTFHEVATTPADVALSLVANGTYPALSWIAFFLVGLGLGRLPLDTVRTQANILLAGGVLALVGPVLSGLLLNGGNRWSRIAAQDGTMTVTDVVDIDMFGPADDLPLPTSSWWWLAVDGPHTNTPLALVSGIGFALLAVGSFLLVARTVEGLLTPLISVGSMTLTLYTAHLLFLSVVDTAAVPSLWLLLQLFAAAVFATAWLATLGRGPLEAVVYRLARLPLGSGRPRRRAGKHAVV